MSNICCREFRGWCRSFTRTEAYLSLLELIFLIVFFAVLIFVILHFLACVMDKDLSKDSTTQVTSSDQSTESEPLNHQTTIKGSISTPTPLSRNITCTLEPSLKTTPVTHYYDGLQNVTETNEVTVTENDQEEQNMIIKDCFIALVKYTSPQDLTIECTLTIVSEQWTITAASCIPDVNRTDLLENYFMIEGLGVNSSGILHPISEVMIHPQYRGSNINCDLAAIKSEDNIITKEKCVILPNLVDYLTVTIGERMNLFSFVTNSRSVDKNSVTQRIRHIQVYKLPLQQCSNDHSRFTRHLLVGGSVPNVYRRFPICAGVVVSRRTLCYYCAGAPLLYRGVLLGVMANNPNCGLSCDPAIYVNIPTMVNWIRSVIND